MYELSLKKADLWRKTDLSIHYNILNLNHRWEINILRSSAYSFAVLCSPLWLMFVFYEFLGRRSFIDPIWCNSCMVLSMFLQLVLANSLCFFLCETSIWHLDSCPPEDTWYGVIPWVLRVLGQGLKSECARDIFDQSFLWLLRHTDEPQKGRNSCLDYNPALFWVLSVSCWCLGELIFT